jgi:DNA repair photolyase
MEAPGIKYKQVECKSLLNKSGLAGYAVNCYSGCGHACVYCYARFATRYSHPHEDWGNFVDIKINAPQVLAREVKRKPAGQVMLSSVCDGWQPAEKDFLLTRQCLEILLRYRFRVSILTKNVRQRGIRGNGYHIGPKTGRADRAGGITPAGTAGGLAGSEK